MGRRARTWSLTTLLLVASTAACGPNGGDGAAPNAAVTTEPTESTEVTSSSSPGRPADGVLTIGTLLPVTGPGNEIGIAGINAVNVGITEINDDGGVLGQPVRWVNASEGETMDEASAGIIQLLENNVDAVIGPASSLVALELLDELMNAGVVVCSPTATALALNDFPNRELFFRTVPSDSLTAQALAVFAENTGVDSYAVVYLDDQFGRPFAKQTISRLSDPEVPPELAERPFPSDATPEELAELATELAELAPRAIVLIADAERGWAMLQAMAPVFATDPPFILVNDALRSPPSTDVVADLPEDFRNAIQGLSPTVPPAVPAEPAGAYATNSLDCLNLIALATVEAGTDDPAEIAAEMVDVSFVGSLCNEFLQCRNIAEQDRSINYQGANSIDLSERGDPARGRVGGFTFDATGLDVPGAPAQITELTE